MKDIKNIALSGGGFRAAYFHFGALYAMSLNGELNNLKSITSVSGGSIAAGIILNNIFEGRESISWPKNSELSDIFKKSYIQLIKKSRLSPRTRALSSFAALIKGVVRNEFGFSNALNKIIKKWFSSIDDSKNLCHIPTWNIVTSNYCDGKEVLLVFNKCGIENSLSSIPISSKQISSAICASAAVPGVFEPVNFSAEYYLGDGGILDNLGIHALESICQSDYELSNSVCLDASALVSHIGFVEGWSSPLRAMDMLMEQDRRKVMEKHNSLKIYSLRNFGKIEWKEKVALLRTDLDDFSFNEAALIFLAGFQAVNPGKIPEDEFFGKDIGIWKLVNESLSKFEFSGDKMKKEKEKAYYSLMKELDRGGFGLYSGLRSDQAVPMIITSASFIFCAIFTGNLILFLLLVSVGIIANIDFFEKMSLISLSIYFSAFISIIILILYLKPKDLLDKKIGKFLFFRRLIGGVFAGPISPVILIISIYLRISVYFSSRDISGIRNRINKLYSKV